MKKTILALGVSVLALAAPATAGDGFYMGLGGAYVSNGVDTTHNMTAGTFYTNPANSTAITNAPIDDLSTDGYGASIFAGYGMHVTPQIKFGLEADATVFDGETNSTVTAPYPSYAGVLGAFRYTVSHEVSQQVLASLRAKAGLDLGFASVFVTGGAAMTDIELRSAFSDNGSAAACVLSAGPPPVLGNPACTAIPVQGGRDSKTLTGWVVGGGFDIPLGGSTSLRAEYHHYDFGDGGLSYSRTLTRTPSLGATPPLFSGSTRNVESDVVRIGLAWDLNL